MKHLNQTVLGFAITFVLATGVHGDGSTSTGSMAYQRYNHTATRLLDGRVLVVAGRDVDYGPTSSAELFDPATGIWTTTSSLNNDEAREFHTATLLPNGKVLVAGGIFRGGYTYLAYSAQLYDPINGTWTLGGPSGFYGHTATLLANGKVLIVGGTGIQGSGPYSSAILYDPANSSMSVTGSLGMARYFHTATLLANGKVLVVGGQGTNGTDLTSAELYNPSTGTWTNTGSLGTARSGHTATLLPNGKVLVVGGTTAELYNPATGTWSPTGSPAHGGDTATLLPNGKVLVVGAVVGEFGQPLPVAELYDPATGTWSPAASPVAPRAGHTATLLANGRVLLAGGFINSAEIYESFLNPIVNPIKSGDGSFQLGFSNPSGVSYHVLASTDFAASLNTWSNLGPATETPPGSGQFQFTDHQAPNYSQRFYRVISP
jgi:Galactose oxidase, central domain